MENDQRITQILELTKDVVEILSRIEKHPGDPNDYVSLARKYYEFIPYAREEGGAIAALQQATEKLEQAMLLFEQQNLLTEAVAAASLFVAFSNELANTGEGLNYIEAALEKGEKVLLANLPPTMLNGAELYPLAHNLANTCIFFAQHADALQETQYYYERGLIFANAAREALDIGKAMLNDSAFFMGLESSLRLFIALHTNFAMVIAEQYVPHVEQVNRYLQEYMELAHSQADGAMQKSVYQLAQNINAHLQRAKIRYATFSSNDDSRYDLTISDYTAFVDQNLHVAAERLEVALKEIEEILSLLDLETQRTQIAKTLDTWYAELADELAIVLRVIGVNYHMCRIFLALGGVVSGRLGIAGLQGSILADWQFSHVIDKDTQNISPQELPYMAQSEFIIMGIILAINSLLVCFEQIPTLREEIRRDLRRRSAHLLRTTLSQNLSLQHLNEKVQPVADDLLLLLQLLPEGARKEVLDSYYETNLST